MEGKNFGKSFEILVAKTPPAPGRLFFGVASILASGRDLTHVQSQKTTWRLITYEASCYFQKTFLFRHEGLN
jgi:hypothetical protein